MKILKPIAHSKVPKRTGGNSESGRWGAKRAAYDSLLAALARLSIQQFIPIEFTDTRECITAYQTLHNRGVYIIRRGSTLYVQGQKES